MRKADILKQQKLHRGDSHGFSLNFLVNFSAPARLMHSFLPPTGRKNDILQAAMRAYIIGMAASLETYFRDLYIYLLERDLSLVQKALDENGRRESPAAMSRYLADGVSGPEFAAAQVSFQSAEVLDRSFSIFFSDQSFFDVLDQFELACAIPSVKHSNLVRLKLFHGWRLDLAKIFILRHEFAHDANSKTQLDSAEMRQLETTAILLCQFCSHLPEIAGAMLRSSVGVPAILLIADLISDDWELVDDEPSTTAKGT